MRTAPLIALHVASALLFACPKKDDGNTTGGEAASSTSSTDSSGSSGGSTTGTGTTAGETGCDSGADETTGGSDCPSLAACVMDNCSEEYDACYPDGAPCSVYRECKADCRDPLTCLYDESCYMACDGTDCSTCEASLNACINIACEIEAMQCQYENRISELPLQQLI